METPRLWSQPEAYVTQVEFEHGYGHRVGEQFDSGIHGLLLLLYASRHKDLYWRWKREGARKALFDTSPEIVRDSSADSGMRITPNMQLTPRQLLDSCQQSWSVTSPKLPNVGMHIRPAFKHEQGKNSRIRDNLETLSLTDGGVHYSRSFYSTMLRSTLKTIESAVAASRFTEREYLSYLLAPRYENEAIVDMFSYLFDTSVSEESIREYDDRASQKLEESMNTMHAVTASRINHRRPSFQTVATREDSELTVQQKTDIAHILSWRLSHGKREREYYWTPERKFNLSITVKSREIAIRLFCPLKQIPGRVIITECMGDLPDDPNVHLVDDSDSPTRYRSLSQKHEATELDIIEAVREAAGGMENISSFDGLTSTSLLNRDQYEDEPYVVFFADITVLKV